MTNDQVKKVEKSGKVQIEVIYKGVGEINVHSTDCCLGPYTIIW